MNLPSKVSSICTKTAPFTKKPETNSQLLHENSAVKARGIYQQKLHRFDEKTSIKTLIKTEVIVSNNAKLYDSFVSALYNFGPHGW